jgi:hypothetical protein
MTETETCVRCHEHPAVVDAAAHEQPGTHAPYAAELGDHCEDCLEAGQHALDAEHANAAADWAAGNAEEATL